MTTPSRKLLQLGSSPVEPDNTARSTAENSSSRGKLGSPTSPSMNMMKLDLAEINEESEYNRFSSSRREAAGAHTLADSFRRMSREEVAN